MFRASIAIFLIFVMGNTKSRPQTRTANRDTIPSEGGILRCEEFEQVSYIFGFYNSCTQCMPNYCVYGRICKRCEVENCRLYLNRKKKCQSCNQGYYLSDDQKSCLQQDIPNCENYVDQRNVCNKCEDGFDLNSNQCIRLLGIIDCRVPSPDFTYCRECNNLFFLRDAGCSPITKQNCMTNVINKDACLTCQEDYYVNQGECFEQNIENCSVYRPNENICTECRVADGQEFVVHNEICVASDSSQCINESSGECTQCNDLFFPVKDSCIALNIDNCIESDGINQECDICSPNYSLSTADGTCKAASTTKCTKNTDDSSTQCDICDEGHYPDQGICTEQSLPNCQRYELNQNFCAKCESNEYQLVSGICQMSGDDNCASYVQNTLTCEICENLYYPIDGNCFSINDSNCKENEGIKKFCTDCNEGYFPGDQTPCQRQSVESCSTYEPNTNICTQCNQTYLYLYNKCLNT